MHLSELKAQHVSELIKMGEALEIENVSRLRKQELMFAIMKKRARQGEQIFGDGVLEVLPDGFGFLRSPDTSFLASTDDIYLSPSQIRRFNLHTGDMIEGEVRTAGPGFDLRIETTPDERMQGRIAVALGYPDKSDGAVNSLHFGNMLWSPELALVLPIARDGKISKELTVQPRFRHIVNTPVLGMLSVTGLPEVVSVRVPIAFKEVV